MEAEFGGAEQVRFLPPEAVRMYDSEGKIIYCKCGKPAGAGIFGKVAFKVWCEDCNPYAGPSAKFVYRSPFRGELSENKKD